MSRLTAAMMSASLVVLSPVAVQAQAQTQISPAAAARIPNTFDAPAPATPAAPAAALSAAQAQAAEAALRQIILDAQGTGFDYARFTPDLANRLRAQEAVNLPAIRGFGALQELAFSGEQDGAAQFLVLFEETPTQWVIDLNAEGKVTRLLFRRAPPEASEG